MSEAGDFKYWAFISYSHQDRRWAGWLRRRMERYRLPDKLVGQPCADGPVPSRLYPVFRDRDELSSSSELGPEIERALRASRYLVVICSPYSARSKWVNEEIRYFKSLGRADRVRSFIVGGRPHAGDGDECFAPELLYVRDAGGKRSIEPMAADARSQGDGRDKALLKLIAGLLGLGYDELRRRDLQSRNRRLAGLSIFATLIAALTITLAVAAYIARGAAERSRAQAEDLIGFMLGDLHAKLEPVGRLDVLDAVGERAMRYFSAAAQDGETDATLAARARTLRQIGEIRVQQGHQKLAAQSFAAALELDRKLVQRQPRSAQALFNLGQSEYWTGYAAWLEQDYAGAQAHLLAYRDIALRLVAREPDNSDWQQEVGYAESNLGTLAEARGELDVALQRFSAAHEVSRKLAQRFPDKREYQLANSESLAWLAAVQEKRERYDEAQQLLQQQSEILSRLSNGQPEDMSLKFRLDLALLLLANLQLEHGEARAGLANAERSLQLGGQLQARDPDNLEWRHALAHSHLLLASAAELAQQLDPAEQQAQQALTLLRRCYEHDSQQLSWRRSYLQAANRLADLQLARGKPAAARQTLETVTGVVAGLKDDNPANLGTALEHALLLRELKPGRDAPDLSTQLTRLQTLAPSRAEPLRLRLAVIDNADLTTITVPSSLQRCDLGRLRLQRFLERHRRGSLLGACSS